MMPTDVRCDTCINWRADLPAITTGARRPDGADPTLGTCMFSPPAVVVLAGVPVSVQAETRAERFCGEWLGSFEWPDGPDDGESVVVRLSDRRAA